MEVDVIEIKRDMGEETTVSFLWGKIKGCSSNKEEQPKSIWIQKLCLSYCSKNVAFILEVLWKGLLVLQMGIHIQSLHQM